MQANMNLHVAQYKQGHTIPNSALVVMLLEFISRAREAIHVGIDLRAQVHNEHNVVLSIHIVDVFEQELILCRSEIQYVKERKESTHAILTRRGMASRGKARQARASPYRIWH